MLIGEITDSFLQISKVDLSLHSYKNISCDLSKAEIESDVLKICADAVSLNNPKNSLINLKISGKLKDEINIDFRELSDKLSELCLYIRLEEAYTRKYAISLIKEENSVRGEFVRQVLSSYDDEEFINRVIEKGMKYL